MKTLIFLSMLLFVFGSCKKEFEEIAIDSDIGVAVELTDAGVIIHGVTDKVYGCLGYKIIHIEKVFKNSVQIRFQKVEVPNVCLTAMGPAECRINLGKLSPGEYTVVFKLNFSETKGKLILGDETAELILESGGTVKPM